MIRRRPRSLARRLSTVLAAGAAAAILLAGCVSIPFDGPVVENPIASDDDNAELTLAPPRGPRDGATPEEIVQGFAAAGIGPQDGYAIAKQFLTPEFAAEWSPNERVLVVQGRGTPVSSGPDAYELNLMVEAEVDNVGRYTTVATSTSTVLDFDLVEVDGQWRIDEAPNGTVVVAANFRSVFDAYPLYFFDPSLRFLVPDLRWFPRLPTASSRIVRSLLEGPSSWLASGALVTAFPTGTQLVAPPTVDEATATIDLSAEVLAADASTKRRIVQQLQQSLISLDTITSIALTVNEIPVDVPDIDVRVPEAAPRVDPNPLVLRDERFGFLSGSNLTEVPGVSDVLADLEPTGAVLARPSDGEAPSAAALTSDGVAVVRSEESVLLDARSGLITPSMDPHGFVWSVPAGSPDALQAFGPDNSPHSVISGLSASSRVVSLEISRDGTRALIAVQTPSGPSLLVAAIRRGSDLVPLSLGTPLVLPTSSTELLDVAWVDGSSVAVLEADGGQSRVRVWQVGGVDQLLGGLVDGIQIVGGNNGTDGLRIVDADGALHQTSSGGGWRRTGTVVSLLATQQ